MEVLIANSTDDVARTAARAVLDGLSAAGPSVLGLATGSSPLGLYAHLGELAMSGEPRLNNLVGVALDEYVGLPRGHEHSYRSTLEREVCDVIGLPREGLHVPDGTGTGLPELAQAARDFEVLLVGLGGVDVQILGLGSNGHLGFNEPGSSLRSRTRVKRLAERTRFDNARFFASPDDVPTHCITQGLGTIVEARRLVMVATGTGKAEAVRAALEGPLSASCPASVLQWHPDAVVVLDESAASLLRNTAYYNQAARGLGTTERT